MFPTILALHSLFRWLMCVLLLLSIGVAWHGLQTGSMFSPWKNRLRHYTATITHIQLMFGIWIYSQSALVKYFFSAGNNDFGQPGFFAVVHILIMLAAVVFITLGSAFAKRKTLAGEKYRTMLCWFVAALVLVLIAVPWPFSPFAQRVLFRSF
ncbi:MAG: hypothetical protein EOO09_09115 [Chitinophagaceae bacterium]|nr:MAG: hypothetical protein EOO09_09115 [Chitinophagaceae bacterium]